MKFSEDRTFVDYLFDFPYLFRQFLQEVSLTRGAVIYKNCFFVCVILGTLLYVVSPFDLIPEAVFGVLGLVDDLGILGFACMVIAQAFMAILRGRNDAAVRAR
jgi:RING finger protein 170